MITRARGSRELLLGVNVPTTAGVTPHPVEFARRAEILGFDFVSSNDHPCGTTPNYETWTLLNWIAARTSRITVASRVLGVPYRAPAMVAKMAESLNRLSGGRLVLGLGGGASDDEFRAFGLDVPTGREKIDGLEEAVQIVRGLWTSTDFSFEGRHHRTNSANIEPKPEGAIPIWLGTFGKNALRVTGRVADGWIPTFSMASPEDIPRMRERIFEGAKEAGRNPEDIKLVYNIDLQVGERQDLGPGVVAGPPNQIVDRLGGFVRLGFTGFNFGLVGSPEEQIEMLASEVVPSLRAQVPAGE